MKIVQHPVQHKRALISLEPENPKKTQKNSTLVKFETYLTPNPQEMKRLRVWKMAQNLNRYPPAKQLKRGCSTLDMEPFWESRLKMSPGEMMQMGALENDTGC